MQGEIIIVASPTVKDVPKKVQVLVIDNDFSCLDLTTKHEEVLNYQVISDDEGKQKFMKANNSKEAAFVLSKPPSISEFKNLLDFIPPILEANKTLKGDKRPSKCGPESLDDDTKKKSARNKVKKTKLIWTEMLHYKFLEAIQEIGYDKAVPSKILKHLKEPGLTREHVASHLQKFRNWISKGKAKTYPLRASMCNFCTQYPGPIPSISNFGAQYPRTIIPSMCNIGAQYSTPINMSNNMMGQQPSVVNSSNFGEQPQQFGYGMNTMSNFVEQQPQPVGGVLNNMYNSVTQQPQLVAPNMFNSSNLLSDYHQQAVTSNSMNNTFVTSNNQIAMANNISSTSTSQALKNNYTENHMAKGINFTCGSSVHLDDSAISDAIDDYCMNHLDELAALLADDI